MFSGALGDLDNLSFSGLSSSLVVFAHLGPCFRICSQARRDSGTDTAQTLQRLCHTDFATDDCAQIELESFLKKFLEISQLLGV